MSEWDDLQQQQVTVRRLLGESSSGPHYAPAEVLTGVQVDRTTRLVRDARHREVVSSATIRATRILDLPVGSLYQLDAGGPWVEALNIAVLDSPGLGMSSTEVLLP